MYIQELKTYIFTLFINQSRTSKLIFLFELGLSTYLAKPDKSAFVSLTNLNSLDDFVKWLVVNIYILGVLPAMWA